jgi:hypothetical protein
MLIYPTDLSIEDKQWEDDMGLMANAVALPMIERQVLRNLETHFIAPEI